MRAHDRAAGGSSSGRREDREDVDESRQRHDSTREWHALAPDEQRAAIKRMAADGWTDHGIAHATRLAVEQVRHILAERHA